MHTCMHTHMYTQTFACEERQSQRQSRLTEKGRQRRWRASLPKMGEEMMHIMTRIYLLKTKHMLIEN